MNELEGLWWSESNVSKAAPPTWLNRASIVLLIFSAIVIALAWAQLSEPPWILLFGALAGAILFQLKNLNGLVVSLGNAAFSAALLCLAPQLLPFSSSETERWTIFATGLALLTAPLLSGIWSSLFISLRAILRMRTRQSTARAALMGEVDALVLLVQDRVGGWVDVTLHSLTGESSAVMTMSTFQRLPGEGVDASLDLRGGWFLLHGPVLAEGERVALDKDGARIIDAARLEFLGTSPRFGRHPAPFSSALFSSLAALAASHLILLEAVVLSVFWASA
jgi:hypothetical protein